ncbi:hypothetical protein C7E23_08650 [Elizabethkingia anophelis]|nr:hypothetical protein C7E23_08650 [Elizabethkingia anophelis]
MKNLLKTGTLKKRIFIFFQGYYKKDNVYGNNTSYLVAKRAKDIIPEIEDYVLINGSGYAGVAVSDKKIGLYRRRNVCFTIFFLSYFLLRFYPGTVKRLYWKLTP